MTPALPAPTKHLKVPADTLYEVFGRLKADDLLCHLGSLHAPNTELAHARAMLIYAEKDWAELCLAPASAFTNLIAHAGDEAIGFA